jgi:hypothetical protein
MISTVRMIIGRDMAAVRFEASSGGSKVREVQLGEGDTFEISSQGNDRPLCARSPVLMTRHGDFVGIRMRRESSARGT